MSASLVGSEMCIRDSPRSPPRPPCRDPHGPGISGPQRPSRREQQPHRSVSYTHLTLPTICSV
eukprot:469084-Alexandrium_andersonii.AAC.1